MSNWKLQISSKKYARNFAHEKQSELTAQEVRYLEEPAISIALTSASCVLVVPSSRSIPALGN